MSRNRSGTRSLGPGLIVWNGPGTRQGQKTGSCEHGFHKMRGMSRPAEELLASQERTLLHGFTERVANKRGNRHKHRDKIYRMVLRILC